MKRYRIKSHFRFITFLVIVFMLMAYLITSIAGLNIADSADNDNFKYQTVTVAAGDTIWTIAEEHADGQDIRRVVYDIQEINSIDDCIITAGEHLKIPVYE